MEKVSINDFSDLVEIGHGAFGTVFRAIFKKTKRIFALKRMQKSHLQKQNMISQINNQIKISTTLKHDNIIKVYDCFQDQEYIYLVLQLAENGQLYQKLKKMGRFDQRMAKKMIKDVIAAVEYLHSRSPPIVHRDIKPENLLLDKNNKVKLADFGWSTVLNKPRKTYCGTVDYLAPEMIDKSGHDEKLDIWCIGVLVYELLTGRTPFLGTTEGAARNPQTVYDNILNMRIQFPADFPTLAKDFVLGMIKRNPKQRMSFPEIKNHPWLKQKSDTPIKFEQITGNNKEVKVSQPATDSSCSQIITSLNKRIRQLQQQNIAYKLRVQELQKNTDRKPDDHSELNRLMNEVRRLKVVEEMNDKYKKKQEEMWQKINQKQKQIIKMKTDLKRVDDFKSQIQRLESQKQKFQQKSKRLQKQLQHSEQKNRQITAKLDEASSGISNRVKNGHKITKEEIQSPEFITFLQDQIAELCQKFQSSKQIVSKMIQKENSQKFDRQELSRLKSQEKKMRQLLRAELRQQFENEKDQLLSKVRNELMEERQKYYKQREELKSIYEEGTGSNSQTKQTKSTRQQDLQGELRNVRELNQYYEKTLNKQKHEIEDLRQQLKRKK